MTPTTTSALETNNDKATKQKKKTTRRTKSAKTTHACEIPSIEHSDTEGQGSATPSKQIEQHNIETVYTSLQTLENLYTEILAKHCKLEEEFETTKTELQATINELNDTKEIVNNMKNELKKEKEKAVDIEGLVNNLISDDFKTPRRSAKATATTPATPVLTQNMFAPLQNKRSAKPGPANVTVSTPLYSEVVASPAHGANRPTTPPKANTPLRNSVTTPHNSPTGTPNNSNRNSTRTDRTSPYNENENTDLLIITDSMARNINPKRLYRSKKVTIHHLDNGKNINAALTYARNNQTPRSPTAVTLIVGTNDLIRKTPTATMDEMKTLTDTIRRRFPSTTIIISEIMPRPQHEAFNNKAREYNRLLRQYTSEQPTTRLMSQQSIWQTTGLFMPDRLHLTRTRGTAALVTNMKAAVSAILGLPTYTVPRRAPTTRPTHPTQHNYRYASGPRPMLEHRTSADYRRPADYDMPPRRWMPETRPNYRPLLRLDPRDHAWPTRVSPYWAPRQPWY